MSQTEMIPVLEIECPCCGDVGAEADDEGMFMDGQALVCGFEGHVTCDTEEEPDILILDCECSR